jgi:hypothetical protein
LTFVALCAHHFGPKISKDKEKKSAWELYVICKEQSQRSGGERLKRGKDEEEEGGKKELCTFSLSRCGNVLITSFTPVVVIMYAPG